MSNADQGQLQVGQAKIIRHMALYLIMAAYKARGDSLEREDIDNIDLCITKYLQRLANNELREDDSPLPGDIKLINKHEVERMIKGCCSGFSSLWLYAKWLQAHHISSGHGYEWFINTIKIILDAGLDCEAYYNRHPEYIKDVESFIQYVELFQNPAYYLYDTLDVSQQSLNVILQDNRARSAQVECAIAATLTLEQLVNLLKTDVVAVNKLVHIGSVGTHNHATAIYRDHDSYYYFDPNHAAGEIKTTSIETLARAIYRAHTGQEDSSKDQTVDCSLVVPIVCSVFTLDAVRFPTVAEKHAYEASILAKIMPEVHRITDEKKTTMLHAAVRGNCLKSAEYCLGVQPDLINQSDVDGYTAIMWAARLSNNYEMVELLLKKGATLHAVDNCKMTALMLAIQRENNKIAKFIAENPHYKPPIVGVIDDKIINLLLQQPTVDLLAINSEGDNILMQAIKGKNAAVVKLLLNHKDIKADFVAHTSKINSKNVEEDFFPRRHSATLSKMVPQEAQAQHYSELTQQSSTMKAVQAASGAVANTVKSQHPAKVDDAPASKSMLQVVADHHSITERQKNATNMLLYAARTGDQELYELVLGAVRQSLSDACYQDALAEMERRANQEFHAQPGHLFDTEAPEHPLGLGA